MIIRTLTITPFEQNARILADTANGEAFVFDPGGEISTILAGIPRIDGSDRPCKISGVVLTHSHIDHAGGVAELILLLEKTQNSRPKLYGHAIEASMRKSIAQQAAMFGLPPAGYQNCPEPDVMVGDKDVFRFGSLELQALFTPGHSPGHLSFFIPKFTGRLEAIPRGGRGRPEQSDVKGPLLIAGDALFAGSIGRTDLPGGNHAQLLTSIREKLLTLPGETIVLSGHGDNTTIEREKGSNPFLQ